MRRICRPGQPSCGRRPRTAAATLTSRRCRVWLWIRRGPALVARHPDRSLPAPGARTGGGPQARAVSAAGTSCSAPGGAEEGAAHGAFRDVTGAPVLSRPHGLRRPVHAAHPSHWQRQPQGREQRAGGGTGRCGHPWAIGSAAGGHKDMLAASWGPSMTSSAAAGGTGAWASRSPWTSPSVRPGPSLCEGAPAMVQAPARRQRAVRREPAQEVPGHLSPSTSRLRGLRALWEELQERRRVSGSSRACGSSASTIRTPSRSPSGSGSSARSRRDPEVIFLAEAFTRPKVMHRLAKLGFTQSYTYFTWRNTKRELVEYFTELAHGRGREYFRPNVWPNTPDILHEALQSGVRAAFRAAGARRHAVGQLRHLRAGIRADGERAARTRAARSTGTRRNTSCGIGARSPGQPALADRAASTAFAATIRRCSPTDP